MKWPMKINAGMLCDLVELSDLQLKTRPLISPKSSNFAGSQSRFGRWGRRENPGAIMQSILKYQPFRYAN
jgi:hypothetical protein